MEKSKNIVLIGFMGVGKGTTARALAKEASIFAIDTDDLIESIEKRSIKKIFLKEGEDYFREVERGVGLWLQDSVKNSIISTGGGFFKVPNLKNIGTIVYLHGSFEWIIERLKNHPNSKKKFKKRPLLNDTKRALELYEQRLPIYKNLADVVIDTEERTPLEISKEIILKVKSLQ